MKANNPALIVFAMICAPVLVLGSINVRQEPPQTRMRAENRTSVVPRSAGRTVLQQADLLLMGAPISGAEKPEER